jgi:hypothetical protein
MSALCVGVPPSGLLKRGSWISGKTLRVSESYRPEEVGGSTVEFQGLIMAEWFVLSG